MQVLSVHDAAAGDDNDDLLAKYIYGKDDYWLHMNAHQSDKKP